MAIQNRFDTKCSNPICPEGKNKYKSLAAGYGFAVKINGSWRAYCPTCCPEKIQPQTGTSTIRKLTKEGKVFTAYEPDNLPLFRSFPGARWNKIEKCWEVSTSQSDRERVIELADKLQLEVDPELRNIVVSVAATAALHKGLYSFQIKGVQFLSIGKHRLLGDEMGTGKTIQSLCALPEKAKCLVVCPKSITYNWQAECKKWRPDLTPVVLTSKHVFRWPSAGEVVITNYESLPERFIYEKDKPAQPTEGDIASAKETITIYDEAHKISNYKSQRSKKACTITKIVKQVWALTGTPLLNHPNQLWGMLSSCGMANEVFGSWTNFMRLFNAYKDRWGGITWGMPSPEVPERLRRVMLRRTRAEVLPDLPKKTYTTMVVNGISDKAQKMLDDLQEEWGDYIGTTNELPPFEEFSKVRAELAAGRVDIVLDYVENCEEQEIPLVVASAHRAPIDALDKRDGWATITGSTPPEMRQTIVERFQRGELKGIGLTVQAGGVGITLTRAWRMLFADMDWTPANNAQAEDRICRIGQESSKVEIVRMVSNHPLDQHVMNLIAQKIAMIDASIEHEATAVVPEPIMNKIEGETEEQYQARLVKLAVSSIEGICSSANITISDEKRAEMYKMMRVEQAKAKVKDMAVKYKSKIGKWLEQDITPDLNKSIRDAFNVMVSNDPDYAEEKNNIGFNKPDSHIARFLGYNLSTDDECRSMWGILYKYKSQLQNKFPMLWPK